MWCAAVDDGATSTESKMNCTRPRWPQKLDAWGSFSAFLMCGPCRRAYAIDPIDTGEVGVDAAVSQIVEAEPGT